MNGVIVRLLHLPRVQIRQEHLFRQLTSACCGESTEDSPDPRICEYRFLQTLVFHEMPEVLVGQDHVQTTLPHLVEHGREIVRDVFLELVKVKREGLRLLPYGCSRRPA